MGKGIYRVSVLRLGDFKENLAGMQPKVNCELWEMRMCRCRFIGCDKCTIWCGMFMVGGCVCGRGVYGNSL